MEILQEISNITRNSNMEYVFYDLFDASVLNVILKYFNKFSYYPWIFSLIGSTLVGLSGIFPLLVIPIEEGENLSFGDGANRLRVLLSFTVGALLSDVFLHLLPEAWKIKTDSHSHPSLFTGVWVLIGMLVFVIVEKLSQSFKTDEKPIALVEPRQYVNLDRANGHANGKVKDPKKKLPPICFNNNIKEEEEETKEHYHISGYLNLMANSVDNFTHGLAIGGSFSMSFKMGVLSTFAILIHELPHEVGDFAILLKSGFSRWDAAKAQLCTASAGIMGSMVAVFFGSLESKTSWIPPFTAGGFLHIALVTLLPDLVHEESKSESCKQLGSFVFGMAVIGFVATFFE